MPTELAVAVLPTADLTAARAFYVEGLGFDVDFEFTGDDGSGMIGLRRGSMRITLDSPMDGHGRNACVALHVDDADRYYEEWRVRVAVEQAPRDEPWSARTFGLTDPSGNTIFVIGPRRAEPPPAHQASARTYVVRDATPSDIDLLVSFTLQEAREAEGLELAEAGVRRGVEGGFGGAPFSTYWIAEADGRPAGSISVVREWSNFRGGQYWWVQSLFITPEHRGTGLLRRLLNHASEAARASGALDLRLYAHHSNARALRVYRREGFDASPYVIMTRGL